MTPQTEVHLRCAQAKLAMATYSPGDGKTRYRFFFPNAGDTLCNTSSGACHHAEFFGDDELFTALGVGEALRLLEAYLRGMHDHSNRLATIDRRVERERARIERERYEETMREARAAAGAA